MWKKSIAGKAEEKMKTKLTKKLGVFALCGALLCGTFGMTANAETIDTCLKRAMSWSGTKCSVGTQPYGKGLGYYANVYVFVYNKSGSLLGSASKTAGEPKAKITTSVNKSKTTKAMGVHYITSKKHGAGVVYGYSKNTRSKGSTY